MAFLPSVMVCTFLMQWNLTCKCRGERFLYKQDLSQKTRHPELSSLFTYCQKCNMFHAQLCPQMTLLVQNDLLDCFRSSRNATKCYNPDYWSVTKRNRLLLPATVLIHNNLQSRGEALFSEWSAFYFKMNCGLAES